MKRNNSRLKSLRWLIILGIISGLALITLSYASHIILHRTIETYESGAALINVSGRQRMLSQRITMLSLQLVKNGGRIPKRVIREKLLQAVDLMEKSHNDLISEASPLHQGEKLSPQMRRIFFSSPYFLNSKVQNFLSEARALATLPINELTEDEPHFLALLNSNNEELLVALDRVTNQFQREYETRIYKHEELEDWSTVISISLVIGMALFIFFPTIRYLRSEAEVLSDSETRYRSFVENFQGIAFGSDIDFIPLFFQGAVKEITGYSESDFKSGKPRWDEVVHPEDLSIVHEMAERLRSMPNHSEKCQYRIIRKNGEIRWINEIVHNIHDDSGKPVMIEGYLYDMTEKKEAYELTDKSLKELERFNRLAIGREKRMTELKFEVNELLSTMGKEEKYTIHKAEEKGRNGK